MVSYNTATVTVLLLVTVPLTLCWFDNSRNPFESDHKDLKLVTNVMAVAAVLESLHVAEIDSKYAGTAAVRYWFVARVWDRTSWREISLKRLAVNILNLL